MESIREREIVSAVLGDPTARAVLDRTQQLGLHEWWLTAGAVFQNVWNAIEGLPPGHGIKDYDVFYFDDTDLSWEAEDRTIKQAGALFADLERRIELRNEARAHLWYEQKFGVPLKQLTTATDAIDQFAAIACSIGITKNDEGFVIYAPFGTDDLFNMHLRPNKVLAPQYIYEAKAREYQQRWPRLTWEPWD